MKLHYFLFSLPLSLWVFPPLHEGRETGKFIEDYRESRERGEGRREKDPRILFSVEWVCKSGEAAGSKWNIINYLTLLFQFSSTPLLLPSLPLPLLLFILPDWILSLFLIPVLLVLVVYITIYTLTCILIQSTKNDSPFSLSSPFPSFPMPNTS